MTRVWYLAERRRERTKPVCCLSVEASSLHRPPTSPARTQDHNAFAVAFTRVEGIQVNCGSHETSLRELTGRCARSVGDAID